MARHCFSPVNAVVGPPTEPPAQRRNGLPRRALLCRTADEANRALELVQTWVSENGLTLHPTKTKVVDAEIEGFDFLGYHFRGRQHRPRDKSSEIVEGYFHSNLGGTLA